MMQQKAPHLHNVAKRFCELGFRLYGNADGPSRNGVGSPILRDLIALLLQLGGLVALQLQPEGLVVIEVKLLPLVAVPVQRVALITG